MRISDWSSDVCSSDLRNRAMSMTWACSSIFDPLRNSASDYFCAVQRRSHSLIVSCHCTLFCGLRSEEHTSELQSLMRISYAVFCLKKKTNQDYKQQSTK